MDEGIAMMVDGGCPAIATGLDNSRQYTLHGNQDQSHEFIHSHSLHPSKETYRNDTANQSHGENDNLCTRNEAKCRRQAESETQIDGRERERRFSKRSVLEKTSRTLSWTGKLGRSEAATTMRERNAGGRVE